MLAGGNGATGKGACRLNYTWESVAVKMIEVYKNLTKGNV